MANFSQIYGIVLLIFKILADNSFRVRQMLDSRRKKVKERHRSHETPPVPTEPKTNAAKIWPSAVFSSKATL